MQAPRRPARFGSCLALVAVALTSPFVPSAFGGDNVWTSSGLIGGGRVNSLAVDPLDPRTVYAATTGGIFKSGDGGASWESSSASGAEALAIHPVTTATLYAGGCFGSGGVIKTVNGGSTWTAASSGLNNLCVQAIAIDPSNPATIYAGSGNGAFRSTDGGASWRSIRTGMELTNVLALAVDPVNSPTIYAGALLNGVFKSTNRGDRWNLASSGLPTVPNPFVPTILMPPTIEVLVIDPARSSTVFAGGSLPSGVFRTTDAAANWTTVLGFSNALALAIDPSESDTVYAGFLFDGVFRSTDGGSAWSSFNGGLTERSVTALAIDRTGTFLYAGTSEGRVFAFRFNSARLRISLPAARGAPKLVPPRP